MMQKKDVELRGDDRVGGENHRKNIGTKIVLGFLVLGLLAAGCQKITLKQEVPSSPRESYEELPK